MTTASSKFDEYRAMYPAQKPNLQRKQFDDELRPLALSEGLEELMFSAVRTYEVGTPPCDEKSKGINKYLWVVSQKSVPIALEDLRPGVVLQRGYLSHTNLTGGDEAHCGGEVWFTDQSTVIVNGGSSRYRPRSSAELEKIAASFKSAGYRTATMGWNPETAVPFRALRGDPQWI